MLRAASQIVFPPGCGVDDGESGNAVDAHATGV